MTQDDTDDLKRLLAMRPTMSAAQKRLVITDTLEIAVKVVITFTSQYTARMARHGDCLKKLLDNDQLDAAFRRSLLLQKTMLEAREAAA